MKVYISSKITGVDEYQKGFLETKHKLEQLGHIVMNPSILGLNEGFTHEEYMHICYSMIDVCDVICLFGNWLNSQGALLELKYASLNEKQVMII